MIEYLYNAIRATAGAPITITSIIEDDEGAPISDNCHVMLYEDEKMIGMYEGAFDGELWSFVIPADATQGKLGRYWYCISHKNSSLCFKQPLYLI